MTIRFSSYYDWRLSIKHNCVEIYFKTYLKEMGLKPIKGIEPAEYVDVYVAGRWKRDIEAYTLDQTVEIKKKTKMIKELELNYNNICKSLYVINKSAKKSRDTKNKNYYERNFRVVAASKTRQNNLYDLKDKVIKKLVNEEVLKLEGYHKQFENNLLYYKYDKYDFHVPTIDKIENVKYLGEIDTIIAAESKIKDIGFNQAKELLERYMKI